MKISRYLLSSFIISVLFIGVALAGEGKDSSDDAMQQWKDFRETQTLRHEMILELFDVNKEIIQLMRQFNGQPPAGYTEKLDALEARIDDLLNKDEMHSKRMMKKWKQGDDKSWDGKKSWDKDKSDGE